MSLLNMHFFNAKKTEYFSYVYSPHFFLWNSLFVTLVKILLASFHPFLFGL